MFRYLLHRRVHALTPGETHSRCRLYGTYERGCLIRPIELLRHGRNCTHILVKVVYKIFDPYKSVKLERLSETIYTPLKWETCFHENIE